MTNSQIITDIVVKSKDWQSITNIRSKLRKLSQKIIKRTPLKDFLQAKNQLELTITLVNSTQMRKINQQFRNRDKSTNTLSFPAFEANKINFKKLAKTQDYLFIGDILFSLDDLRQEVLASYNKSFDGHLTHLLTHSILHLIGFDHVNNKDAEQMEELEITILKSLQISNPYVDNC